MIEREGERERLDGRGKGMKRDGEKWNEMESVEQKWRERERGSNR